MNAIMSALHWVLVSTILINLTSLSALASAPGGLPSGIVPFVETFEAVPCPLYCAPILSSTRRHVIRQSRHGNEVAAERVTDFEVPRETAYVVHQLLRPLTRFIGYSWNIPSRAIDEVSEHTLLNVRYSRARSQAGGGKIVLRLPGAVQTPSEWLAVIRVLSGEVAHRFHQVLLEGRSRGGYVLPPTLAEVFDLMGQFTLAIGLRRATDQPPALSSWQLLLSEMMDDLSGERFWKACITLDPELPNVFDGADTAQNLALLRNVADQMMDDDLFTPSSHELYVELLRVANDFFENPTLFNSTASYGGHHLLARGIVSQISLSCAPVLRLNEFIQVMGNLLMTPSFEATSSTDFIKHLKGIVPPDPFPASQEAAQAELDRVVSIVVHRMHRPLAVSNRTDLGVFPSDPYRALPTRAQGLVLEIVRHFDPSYQPLDLKDHYLAQSA